ncbi:MAG: hypothetical protein JKY37_24200 [Nannocystaceae bacterium]|nr:hypothetical protein [Nannocystaceae bacterium]
MVVRRRVGGKGSVERTVVGKRTEAGKAAADMVTMDDRPLSVVYSEDGKRLIVALPFELWIISTATLEVERTIELPLRHPTCFEAEGNTLWIGGSHLFHGSMFAASSTKVGTKLGGFVDHVCMVRPRLLCGIGVQGEILWDLDKEEAIHRRKVSEHEVFGLVPAPDGRAVYADGSSHVWVIDPDHASGYMKLKLKDTSATAVSAEGIIRLAMTRNGACLLAARDGAIGWTNRALRLEGERLPQMDGDPLPLAIGGDERWIYVLRPRSVLQRFLVAQPPEDPSAKQQAAPLPQAQQCRLDRRATAMALGADGQLALAGPHADDHLGRLWRCDPASLPWETLRIAAGRTLVEPPPKPAPGGKGKVPSFERTRTKVSGPAISEIKVDAVIGAGPQTLWVTRPQGTAVERPHSVIAAQDVMASDTVVLPAMVRFHEGTARPALVLWPGVADKARAVPSVQWLVWGDSPRGWMPLHTPNIREQGWSRREVFPMQIALRAEVPELPGRRSKIPDRWVDAEMHAALGRECKKLLKVLW